MGGGAPRFRVNGGAKMKTAAVRFGGASKILIT